MRDKSWELMTEEGLKLLEEFRNCKTDEDVLELMEREKKLNESRENNEIPHIDITLDEFCAKYNCTKLEDIMKKYGF